jgi:hypothetical protein
VTNFGVLADIGQRFQMGSMYMEPSASASYLHTSIAGISTGGGTVAFSDGESIRAGVGSRIGTIVPTGKGFSTDFSLLAKLWDEFGSPNTVTVSDGADSESFTNTAFTGMFGEVTAAADLYNANRTFSTFISGGAKFNASFSDWNAKVGLRKSF